MNEVGILLENKEGKIFTVAVFDTTVTDFSTIESYFNKIYYDVCYRMNFITSIVLYNVYTGKCIMHKDI